MGIPNVIQNDTQFNGAVTFPGGVSFPNASIFDAQIAAFAAIAASKLMHLVNQVVAQGSTTTAASETRVIFVAKAPGTLQSFVAGAVVVALTTDTCTVDLKKNGSSVLSAPISLTSSQAARQLVAATITTAGYTTGDVFEWVVTPTHSSGTLATGIFASLDAFQAAQ